MRAACSNASEIPPEKLNTICYMRYVVQNVVAEWLLPQPCMGGRYSATWSQQHASSSTRPRISTCLCTFARELSQSVAAARGLLDIEKVRSQLEKGKEWNIPRNCEKLIDSRSNRFRVPAKHDYKWTSVHLVIAQESWCFAPRVNFNEKLNSALPN